jgi:HPt (histidine-containing phosphotransfer) domain-containing protein
LRKFVVDYADSPATMMQMLSKNKSGAAALAHKLKGAAGNLSLVDVARYAGEIDQKLKAGSDVTGLMTDLQQALGVALASIALYAPVDTTHDSLPPLDAMTRGSIAPLLSALLQALDADNPDHAEPVLNELAMVLPQEHLQLVRATLNDFDFRGAESATRQLAENLEIILNR